MRTAAKILAGGPAGLYPPTGRAGASVLIRAASGFSPWRRASDRNRAWEPPRLPHAIRWHPTSRGGRRRRGFAPPESSARLPSLSALSPALSPSRDPGGGVG